MLTLPCIFGAAALAMDVVKKSKMLDERINNPLLLISILIFTLGRETAHTIGASASAN